MKLIDVARSVVRGVNFFGMAVTFIGMGLLFTMAIVGTISFDIILLAVILKSDNRDHPFITGLLLGSLMSNNHSNSFSRVGLGTLFIVSLIMTLIAIPVSAVCDVPEIGFGLVMGWGIAAATFITGLIINESTEHFQKILSNYNENLLLSNENNEEEKYTSTEKPTIVGSYASMGSSRTRTAPGIDYDNTPSHQWSKEEVVMGIPVGAPAQHTASYPTI